jgi:PAS domain S-box-containing protein
MRPYALIATQEASTARLLSDLTEAEGLEPVVVREGAEARTLIGRLGAPALLITELSLPRADGFTLLGELRRLAPAERSPALVLSAIASFRATAESLSQDLGISGVLSSAAGETELRAAIRGALSRDVPAVSDTAAASTRPAGPSLSRMPRTAGPPGSPAEAARGEASRLAHIASMGIVDDRPPDETLQKLVEDTARAFDVPIALVSLILEDRQWFKAHIGLAGDVAAARGTAREISFCRHVVEGDVSQPLVVPDATVHPYFSGNPLVRQGIVRSYAGAPLVTPGGQVLGTLCIIDNKPLNIGPDEVDALVSLARRVAGELELKSAAARAARQGRDGMTLAMLEAVCSSVESGILVLDSRRKILLANDGLARLFGMAAERIYGMTRDEFILHGSTLCEDRVDFLRRMRVLPEGPFSAREIFHLARPAPRFVRWVAKPIHLPGGTGQLDIFDDVTRELESTQPGEGPDSRTRGARASLTRPA